MALSLVLRRTNIQGFPFILGSNITGVKNIVNLRQLPNRAGFRTFQKISTPKVISPIIAKPVTRLMSSGGDHRLLWTIERVLSLGLAGVLPVTIAYPNVMLDNLCAIMVMLHLHWGLEACCVDYIRPIIFGNVIPKVSLVALYAITALTLGGLLYFNYTDIGIGKAVRKFWAVK